jgi:Acetyltransferase (GNAT) domain
MFLRQAWGRGYAFEACTAALDWFAGALASEPVLLCTQTANDRSMRLAAKLGFTEVERFEEYGAEQWLGMWTAWSSPGMPAPGLGSLLTDGDARCSLGRVYRCDRGQPGIA